MYHKFYLHGSGEKNGAHRRIKERFARTMMQGSRCGWQKVQTKRPFSEETKSVPLVTIELCLSGSISECISQSISQKMSQSISQKMLYKSSLFNFMALHGLGLNYRHFCA